MFFILRLLKIMCHTEETPGDAETHKKRGEKRGGKIKNCIHEHHDERRGRLLLSLQRSTIR
jgi:hypothetical protein